MRARREEVWAAIVAFERMPEWFVGTKKVLLHSPKLGAGAERTVRILTGSAFRERFVQWDEGRAFSFEVLTPPLFTGDWRVRVALEPAADGTPLPGTTLRGTILRWSMEYATTYGMIGKVYSACILRPVLDLALVLSLRKLRSTLERGDATRRRE